MLCASLANTENSLSSECPAVAKYHAMIGISCASTSPSRRSTVLPITSSNRPAFVQAQAVMATFCTLKTLTSRPNTANRLAPDCRTVANAQEMLAKPCEPNSFN
eukprot:gnl/TRDRNA2_/TRDRNA2_161191_c1_seq3.p1 gnl/TRDRNA2_/TRDRNA2_161191_c1~~gnl/TRDRNA2_/TRDRNA2_161191_c1_seq3.p1  ORF type:complete len:104 (+),score=7.51 gnl/TRDRNA2_/TRDRNA2_161191_c1_seq3:590-901(+)